MREFGLLPVSFWSESAACRMSDDGRLLFVYLMTAPGSNLLGCFRLPDGYILADLDWDATRIRDAFAELELTGFAYRDPRSAWVLVPRYLDWGMLRNPNQRKAAARIYAQVPTGPLKRHLHREIVARYPDLGAVIEQPEPADRQHVPNTSERVSEPVANTFQIRPEYDCKDKDKDKKAPSQEGTKGRGLALGQRTPLAGGQA